MEELEAIWDYPIDNTFSGHQQSKGNPYNVLGERI